MFNQNTKAPISFNVAPEGVECFNHRYNKTKTSLLVDSEKTKSALCQWKNGKLVKCRVHKNNHFVPESIKYKLIGLKENENEKIKQGKKYVNCIICLKKFNLQGAKKAHHKNHKYTCWRCYENS